MRLPAETLAAAAQDCIDDCGVKAAGECPSTNVDSALAELFPYALLSAEMRRAIGSCTMA